jgi:integrase
LNQEHFGLPRFTPHDLRRTAATHMTRAGISRFIVGKVLNHSEQGVTTVYDRASYDREKRAALDKWACELRRILGAPKKAKLVAMAG